MISQLCWRQWFSDERVSASGGAALTTQASLFAGLLPIQLINLLNSIGDIVRVKDDDTAI